MPSLTCENCGAEVPDGASFCPHCQRPVTVAELGTVYVPQNAQASDAISAAPQFVVAQARVVYAGFWLRAVAYLIDLIVFVVLLFILLAVIGSFYPAVFNVFPVSNATSLAALTQVTPVEFLLMSSIVWLYYAFFESSSWQATPGKKILRLYVTDLQGRRITFARAIVRQFAKIISGFFLVGYVLAGFTAKKQALHDLLAGCLVLRQP